MFQGLGGSTFSDYMQKYYDDHQIKGRILLFDFNSPENDVIELKLSDGFDQSNFMPHGLSLFENTDTGKFIVYM